MFGSTGKNNGNRKRFGDSDSGRGVPTGRPDAVAPGEGGDSVLVHAGFAMEIVDEHLALESQALWREMGGAGRTGQLQESLAAEIAAMRPSADFIRAQKS